MVSSSLNVECDNVVAKVLVVLLEQPFRHLGCEDIVEVPHRLYDLELEKKFKDLCRASDLLYVKSRKIYTIVSVSKLRLK